MAGINILFSTQIDESNHLYNQSPSTSDENAFLNQSHDRYQQMHQSNQNMIQHDRKMIKEGYDPNEIYFENSPKPIENNGRTFTDQEAMLQGK